MRQAIRRVFRQPAAGGSGWRRDAAGRLIRVRDDGGAELARYVYDATEERLISQEGEVQTYYAWSGSAVVAEYVEVSRATQPVWAKQYVYLDGRLLATIQPSASRGERVEYAHPDRLRTRLVTNNEDEGYYEQVTMPYGVALDVESTGASCRRFSTYDRSSVTSIDYAINRHCDPQQGRFAQVDSLGMKSVDLMSQQIFRMTQVERVLIELGDQWPTGVLDRTKFNDVLSKR